MNTIKTINGGLAAIFTLCLLVAGCAEHPSPDMSATQGIEVVVSNQFRRIYFKLRDEMGDGDRFPRSFSEAHLKDEDADLFIDPETRTLPGSIEKIDEWTDYIYVGNNNEDIPFTPMIISPPENHHGEHGYAIFVDGVFLKLPSETARKLIKEPWMLATNTPRDNIDYMKQRITVNVPKRLKPFYPDAYQAKR